MSLRDMTPLDKEIVRNLKSRLGIVTLRERAPMSAKAWLW